MGSNDFDYLESLNAVRDQAKKVLELGKNAQLGHFDLNLDQLDHVVDFVKKLIKRDFSSPKEVPMHSRWRHFDVKGTKRIDNLLDQWSGIDKLECTRRLLDLFSVSVLLDAGAGDTWRYKEQSSGLEIGRSEGLALASLDMFTKGDFSGDVSDPFKVNASGLKNLSVDKLKKGFQVDDTNNPLVGLEGRVSLLNRLAMALEMNAEIFKDAETGDLRPGNILDFLLKHESTQKQKDGYLVHMKVLWKTIILGFGPIWPETRTKLNGKSLGDVWPCQAMKKRNQTSEDILSAENMHLIPFHKLSQWLTYSLLEPMSILAKIEFADLDLMTGLAEYRSGGLFVDFNVIELKQEDQKRGLARAVADNDAYPVPKFEVYDDVIVEWRALTIALLDIVGERVRESYGLSKKEMPLVKVLEGGTWKAGREIAFEKRPQTKGPPIQIVSDGTVF